jgi:beta-glucosidase
MIRAPRATLSDEVERLLATLTLQEKASLTSGSNLWYTQPVPAKGVPAVMVTDGPHGLRKQRESADHLGVGTSVPATCFPPAVSLGSSWDPNLLRRIGEALGQETRANGVAVLLGPGVNIKRSPLCGRNFEYISEDPTLSGELGTALVTGIQSQAVGASLKHFAANNQESDRRRVSADVDERTLREIYLPAFEQVVTQARPWTVMCSYNRVNGVFASQNPWLLTQVLRDEWGFEGLVVSDWGAVVDRVTALTAGLDLEMPARGGRPDKQVATAVRAGELDEKVLDEAVRRVLYLVLRAAPGLAEPGTADLEAHHALAREAAIAGSVLLKNDPVDGTPLLPLAGAGGLLVVGEFARTPRYQGGGSSLVNPTRLDDALGALRAAAGTRVVFAPGFTIPEGPAGDDGELRTAAVAAASKAGTVVLFLGLPAGEESEGFDRSHLDVPPVQVQLLHAVAAVNPRVVVVLANGGVVTVTGWDHLAPAILETWLPGQAGGTAVADVLLGISAPGGRLAETIPHRLEDTPAFGNFPGEAKHVRYGEGVLVGYRWYDTRDVNVAYPFGHGLTYTTFAYGPLTATVDQTPDGTITVRTTVEVTNTGSRAGTEVVQLYVADPHAAVLRPTHELRAFRKVLLQPGETVEVVLDLDARALSYWHPGLRRWVLEVGSSSRDLRALTSVQVEGEPLWPELDDESTFGEWQSHPVGGPQLRAVLAPEGAESVPVDASMSVMLANMPLRVLANSRLTGLDIPAYEALRDKVTTLAGADVTAGSTP